MNAPRRSRSKVYRNRSDQVLVTGITIAAFIGFAWLSALNSAGTLTGDLTFAAIFSVLIWLGYRIGVRAHVAIEGSRITIVNPLVVKNFPVELCSDVGVDSFSLFFVLLGGRKVRAWGASTSALNSLQRIRNSIATQLMPSPGDQEGKADGVDTRLTSDYWLLIAIFAAYSCEIIIRRAS